MLGRSASLVVVFAILPALSACSADSVAPSAPTLEQPGSFVATTDTDGVIFLIRTLRVVPLDTRESLLEAIHYQGAPSSYDEARTWAKDPSWPVAERHASFSLRAVQSLEPEVVWFRTLSQSELDALR